MKYGITLLFVAITFIIQAQPETERMKRDIEVAENIIASLLQEEMESGINSTYFFAGNDKVQGAYLEGFGVLFTIAPHSPYGVLTWDAPKAKGKDGEEEISIVVPDRRIIRGQRRGITSFSFSDSLSGEQVFRNVVETFVSDYGYLLRQIPDGEKIMIRYGSSLNNSGSWGNVVIAVGNVPSKVYSAAIGKADLEAYEKGRLSREQLIDRIAYTTEGDGTTKEDRDLKLLSSIFTRLYQQDLSETFFMRGGAGYENIEGLGAVLYFNMASKYQLFSRPYVSTLRLDREGNYSLVAPEAPEEAPDAAEAAAKADEAYAGFLAEMKENIVEYGGVAKSLKAGEALIFRLRFFSCEACEVVPDELEITVKQSTLEAYRQGKIDLENAVGQLEVR